METGGPIGVRQSTPRGEAGPWLWVALGSLLVAGLFALFLVVGRIPSLAAHFSDPGLFKRCLVVHVDLSLVVWFYAFTAALFALLPGGSRRLGLGPVGLGVTAGGLLLLFWCIGIDGATPVLSNYVPGIDHPLFLVAIGAVIGGIGLGFVDRRLFPGREEATGLIPPAARPGLRTAAVAYLFALLTFAASATTLPPGLEAEAKLELLFWGGGHVLQFASEAAMVAVWLVLLERALGRAPIPRSLSAPLFGLMLLGPALAPVLASEGVQKSEVHTAFTLMMRWGIFPIVLVFLALCLRAVNRGVREGAVKWSEPRVLAFLASAGLTLTGFVLGALIRTSSTLIPAHYHANIGAVTCAFMAVTPLVLGELGAREVTGRVGRAIRWQPVLYGFGQLVFASGFALAGAHGMARKTYASEQHVRSALEWFGLTVMGVGGLVAVAAGVLFLTWAVRAWGGLTLSQSKTWRRAWLNRLANQHSRG